MPNSSLAYTRADLFRLRDLLEEKTGIYLSYEKLGRLETPLKDGNVTGSFATLDALIQAIEIGSAEGVHSLTQLIEAIATNETYFFRISAHFETLKNYLLPELIQSKRAQPQRRLRIWSAGCSTGEEPYSIAILLLDSFPELSAWNIKILATDIDQEALQIAAEGIYRPWSFRGVKPEIIHRYFQPIDGERRRVDDRVRSMVSFRRLNLKSEPYPSARNDTADLDIVLCRNVTIYFRPETGQKIVNGFYNCLGEGGFLLTGAAEYSPQMYDAFEARIFPETVIYQKSSAREPARPVSLIAPLPPLFTAPPAAEPPTVKAPVVPAEPPPQKSDAVAEAVGLISAGEVDHALVLLAAEAEKGSKDARVFFLLGQIAADRRHLAEATYWLSRTVEVEPLNLWAHYLLGLLWMEEDKADEALRALKKAIYIEPNFALGHFYLGRLHKSQGQIERARKDFSVARSLLASAPLSEDLRGADGMTGRQLLTLVDKELGYEG
jgi:chemotaxis protein methyltransferase CheR